MASWFMGKYRKIKSKKKFEKIYPRSCAIVSLFIVNVSREQLKRRRSSLLVRGSFFHAHRQVSFPFWLRGRFAKIGSASPDRLLLRFLNDSRLRTIRRENGNGRRRNVGVAGTALGARFVNS